MQFSKLALALLILPLLGLAGCSFNCPECPVESVEAEITAPDLSNNPSWDVIVTNRQPLLSFFNSSGGIGARTYDIELDTQDDFFGPNLINYRDIPEETEYVTGKLVEPQDLLIDKQEYYWRVRAKDSRGNASDWTTSRFYVDTESDDVFMGLVRVPVLEVSASSGYNVENIVDWDDPGQLSFWQSTPPGEPTPWVKFDFGEPKELSRFWMLSNVSGNDGWLKDFVWQTSDDGESWSDIPGTEIKGNDTFRNIVDFQPVSARFFRLMINDWYGYAPQINAVIPYSPGVPPLPEIPAGDYVLIIGNEMNGFTFTDLAARVEELRPDLKTVVVPHHEASLEMLNPLERKPVAIINSGNNADYPDLPMFEYNGEFEIIRESDIPILGICAGHQLSAMAYGYTYARSMGWQDISALEEPSKLTKITIDVPDPIFDGIPDEFTAPEIHGWAVAHLPDSYETIASSTYIQAIKRTDKFLYGEQFHAEIIASYNQAVPYLENFLEMAVGERKTK